MAEALCELQSELQNGSPPLVSVVKGATEDFIPKTPATKESRRKHRVSSVPKKGNFVERKLEFKADANLQTDQNLVTSLNSNLVSNDGNSCQDFDSCLTGREHSKDDSFIQFSNGEGHFPYWKFSFPQRASKTGREFSGKAMQTWL